MLDEHAEHRGMTMPHAATALAPLDQLVATVQPLAIAAPVSIAPPTRPGQPWTAKSDAANRPLRTDLTLDGATSRVLTRRDFPERPLIDRIVGYGVAAHEGQLFGWVNQLLGLVTAIGLVLLSVSSVVLWWGTVLVPCSARRRRRRCRRSPSGSPRCWCRWGCCRRCSACRCWQCC